VIFTLVHTEKYRTENKIKIQTIHILKQKKKTIQKTAKQNYPGSVACYDTRPGNESGLLIYNALSPHETA